MPFLSSLQHQHDTYVEVNGSEPHAPPVWNPTFIPDPLEPSTWRERLWSLLTLLRLLGGMVRR